MPMLDPLSRVWEPLGWQPDAMQVARFEALRQELCRWNSRLNLTRLVEGDDYWIAQVFDSLWPWLPLLRAADSEAAARCESPGASPAPKPSDAPRLIDVGTGGGFPGLALAIALPHAHLTLVDSVARKLEAVEAMAREVGLAERVCVRRERVERTGHSPDCRGRFDGAMARAVASAPVVAEYLVPLLKPGGQAVLYRGQWSDADQADVERALVPLRARLEGVERRELPAGRGVRHAVRLVPAAPCPQAYPRAVGLPAKAPLGQGT
ncbi:MAG: 16S rRNA (guanine(527)-N(7))-methyltransferase RsmG [Cyanobacteriota bacterium]|nr:16S rRNA (guanine(527)-N(7))-methyltransferase RsmG [Cyanobacteriota bacterium]